MIRRYGDHNYELLLGRHLVTEDGRPEFLARESVYGAASAEDLGLIPMLDYPDLLVPVADFKAVIQFCNEQKIFPRYHQARAGVFRPRWYQDGIGYCWNFGIAAATMGCRAAEGKPPVRLAGTGLGWLVKWKNQGYFLDKSIAAARERGIPAEEYVPELSRNPREFKEGWETNGLNYRPLEWWDTRRADGVVRMIQQALSILSTGRPGYVGYNWWGHALELVGMDWDESEDNGIVWVLQNSHDDTAEDDDDDDEDREVGVIELVGDRGVPDELYGVRATSFPQAA